MKNKKILVTGGAGFLGSHLCNKLLQQGNVVTALDNLYTGNERNINYLLKDNNFSFIKNDITNSFNQEQTYDQIYNLACPASPIHYQNKPVDTIKTNVIGSINLLELATKSKARIFQASTSEVYGDPLQHPQRESYWGNVNPNGIRSCYDEGKRCAETLFFDYARQYNVEIKVARIFNTYGPMMNPNDGRVVSNFIVQALSGKDITIYGDGSQTRSFCYVDDLIDGFIALMESDASIQGPINLGNPHEFTMRELAQKVIDITGSNSSIVFQNLPADDPRQRKPDISLANDFLSWKPKIELVEGLKKTIEYFSSVL